MLTIVVVTGSATLASPSPAWAAPIWALAIAGIAISMVVMVAHSEAKRTRKAKAEADTSLRQLKEALEDLNSTPRAPSLDEELGDVSNALSTNVARLHDISERAKAFENEVRGLVDKAEAAKTAAALHEDDARKIAILLGAESQARLKEEIEKLSQAHANQIEDLKKSGNRTAWVTFTGGALVGFGVNILTTWMMS